ncbi:MAG: methionyl-tRNA formyltransferase [Polyangiales bacterium]
MRILYLGLPLGALCLARAGHPPVVAATGHPREPGARRVMHRLGAAGALVLGRPRLDDAGVRRLLASARPDALLSFFWPQRIPAELLSPEAAPRGAFGVHPSLLPRWRGPDPCFWTVRCGDTDSGVTLFELTPDYDRGPIVEQRRVAVAPGEDAGRLAHRLDRLALELLCGCADRLARGERLEGTEQDEAQATEAPQPPDPDLAIDWHRPAEDIVRLVRAARPRPGASARLGDRVVEVVAARVAETPPPAALRVAEAWHAPEGLCVRAGEGAVVVERVRTDDGRELSGAEALAQPLG